MPACSVAPSPTRAATCAPIEAASASIPPPPGAVGTAGSSASTSRSIDARSSSASPYVQGTRSLTCATTRPPRARAASIAAGSTLTSVPSDTLPSRGRVVWSSTRSGGCVVVNSRGTSDSREGV